MQVHLQVVGGPYQGETFSVFVTSGVKASIGRAPSNDVAFPATPTVSNKHAFITNQQVRTAAKHANGNPVLMTALDDPH